MVHTRAMNAARLAVAYDGDFLNTAVIETTNPNATHKCRYASWNIPAGLSALVQNPMQRVTVVYRLNHRLDVTCHRIC